MSQFLFVVSNAGPLMVLSKLHVLHLLPALYGRVHIVQSVYDEVATVGIREGYQDAHTLSLFLDQIQWLPEPVMTSVMELRGITETRYLVLLDKVAAPSAQYPQSDF